MCPFVRTCVRSSVGAVRGKARKYMVAALGVEKAGVSETMPFAPLRIAINYEIIIHIYIELYRVIMEKRSKRRRSRIGTGRPTRNGFCALLRPIYGARDFDLYSDIIECLRGELVICHFPMDIARA